MNTRKKTKTILILFAIFLTSFSIYSNNQLNTFKASLTQPTMPNRDEIVWVTGHWRDPSVGWNPLFWNEAWWSLIMYQPLFAVNYEKNGSDQYVGIIGESIEWKDSGSVIEVVLRSEAKWSDGTLITSDDVIFTWWWRLQTHLQWLNTSKEQRLGAFEKISNQLFRLHLKSAYVYSHAVWINLLHQRIVPKHIWEDILNDPNYGNGDIWNLADSTFKNNWLDPSFNETWKVASGAYIPYYVFDTTAIYVRNDNWWGNTVFKQPEAKYIGHIFYSTSNAQAQAFALNEIDWYGGYYPRIWELLAVNPYINTWTLGEEPYFLPISGMVELAPNHLKYPFNELWFRQALAYSLNYTELSEMSASGYLQKARAGWLDNRSFVQKHLYNATVETLYNIRFNTTKAIEILDTYCFKHTDGAWYTDDVPVEHQGMVGSEDDLLSIPGVNVKLGDWQIMTVDGWNDSMIQSTLLAEYFDNIEI
ncbi:MAG: hypothetical protein JSV32_02530 [Dehalococcoidia bacterium]|nr:MAG: hypothetical protein JSV32_02530 [Dehalococcoidia bacterium]